MDITKSFDVVVTTQDSDDLIQHNPTMSQKPVFVSKHLRSLSLSSLASPLDALALACEAEQLMTFEANHGRTHDSELDADISKMRMSRSPDEFACTVRKEESEPTPSAVGTSHYTSPDVLDASYNHKTRSQSSGSWSIECSSDKISSSKSCIHPLTNFISQDFLQEIPSYISLNDVLCGRGGLTNHHPGNIFFRNLVRNRQEEYLRASKRDKANVAKQIVELVRNQEPPGRFLKKVSEKSNTWAEIGDRKAREKTSQALREGAPELREISFKPQETAVILADSQSSVPGSSKDTLEQSKDDLSYRIPISFRMNSFDANMDAISTSSPQSTLPRPRVVSSDSFRSAASVSDGIIDDSSSWIQGDALIKRQKVCHRCFTDSVVEENVGQNIFLPPPIRPPPKLCRTASDAAMKQETEDVIKGPRLKLLKARFQGQKNKPT